VFYSADLGFFGEKKAITGIALQDARIELAGCPHRACRMPASSLQDARIVLEDT
jgi:hypothetical protein